MINFFSFSWEARIFITVLLGLCVLAQTLALVLNFYRDRLNTRIAFKNILEISILFEILVFSLLHGQIVSSYKNGIVVSTGYDNIRIIIFLTTITFLLLVAISNKNLEVFSIIPATLISLPIAENALGGIYPWFFIGALLFFLARSVKISISSIRDIRTNISALSVKHAIDTLDTGVLFSESDGHILLSNNQMRNFMISTTGKIFRNSKDFYNLLVSAKYKSKYGKTELDGQIVYILQDGTALIFKKTEIFIKKKSYSHISVSDVSELWTLTVKLQVQNKELKEKSDQLKETMKNLHILSKEKELENAKIRAHDVLGRRLSVLLRIIQNKEDIDYDLLKSLSNGLLKELKVEKNEVEPHDQLKSIQQTFDTIGVDISFEGEFPDIKEKADLFVDIIREGSTNAVRHGLATEIKIKARKIDNQYALTISNNGYTSSSPIVPGSGIKLMRKKVKDLGGNFNIEKHPYFTLSVVIPEDEQYIQDTYNNRGTSI